MSRKPSKTQSVTVRLSPEEKARLQELAVQQNQTLSQFMRTAALELIELSRRQPVPAVNRQLYYDLGKISEQIQLLPDAEKGSDLQTLLDQVRRKLLGLPSPLPSCSVQESFAWDEQRKQGEQGFHPY